MKPIKKSELYTCEKSSAVLTDAEIKKALECCIFGDCQGCVYGETDQRHCKDDLMQNALDLINRLEADKEALIAGQETLQKALAEKNAEIEKLKNDCFGLSIQCIAMKDCTVTAAEEAVQEFAERLKERAKETVVYKNELCVMGVPFVNVKDIDNLVKEMVGDAE